MARKRNLLWAERLAADATLEEFLQTAIKRKKDPLALRRMRDHLPNETDKYVRWQKSEALKLIGSNKTPALEDLTVPARIASELERAAKHLPASIGQDVKVLPIDFGAEVHTQLANRIDPDASGIPSLPLRQAIHEALTDKFNLWGPRNRQQIDDFRKKHRDARIIIDRLPHDGENFAPRLYSHTQAFDSTLRKGLHTTRKITAPRKAVFGGKTHAR